MAKSLIIGMVAFDVFLHVWTLVKGKYFVVWNYYDWFWTVYWSIVLVLLVKEFYLHKK